MFSLLFATFLALLHVDHQQDFLAADLAIQHQWEQQIAAMPYVPLFHIARTLGPIRQTYFLQPSQPITARSGLVMDVMSGQVLWQKNSSLVRPIASLTKLTTALVFLDTQPDMQAEVTMEAGDDTDPDGSKLQVKPGEIVTVGDLFNACLIGSANNATKAMVRSTGLTQGEFVQRMNAKVRELGLVHTTFHEVTGLNPENTSTAGDYAMLAGYAFRNSTIRATLTTSEYTFITINSKKFHRIGNTDTLLTDVASHVVAAKTGYLDEAGYTFVAESDFSTHALLIVLFGSDSSQQRFDETRSLIQWAETAFMWR